MKRVGQLFSKESQTTLSEKRGTTLSEEGGTTLSEDSQTALSEGCLLYTSPSPRDEESSRMPSSA